MIQKLPLNEIVQGDALRVLRTFPDNSIDCGVTNPPYYGLRDYGVKGQLGIERILKEYLAKMLNIS